MENFVTEKNFNQLLFRVSGVWEQKDSVENILLVRWFDGLMVCQRKWIIFLLPTERINYFSAIFLMADENISYCGKKIYSTGG
jgi:hypothetical protein